MSRGDEKLGDEVLVARRHAGAALAATALRPVHGQRHALDIAATADRNDHILALDQVLVLELALDIDDLGPARHGILVFDLGQLLLHDLDDAQARGEDLEIFPDLVGELLKVVADLVAAERGQPLQPEVEDGLRLLGAEPVSARFRDAMARVGDECDERGDVVRRPVARHQLLLGLGR